MTETEWIEKAKINEEILAKFIERYHPATLVVRESAPSLHKMPITAPGAEMVCEIIRRDIQREYKGDLPSEKFRIALKTGNYQDAYSLLDATWYGVPESTSCWGIDGFSETVALLEDPADVDYEP